MQAIALDGPVGAASALKVCYAAWNKGATALLAGIRALAAAGGRGCGAARGMEDFAARHTEALGSGHA